MKYIGVVCDQFRFELKPIIAIKVSQSIWNALLVLSSVFSYSTQTPNMHLVNVQPAKRF